MRISDWSSDVCSSDLFVMMGGYIAVVAADHGIHPILALPIAAVVMFMYGWIIYILMIRRVIERDMFTSLLATFGLAIVMAQLMNLIFGSQDRKSTRLNSSH